ncbi:hypothetical protein Tco_0994648 [Tanacetum coccineum]
MAARKPRQETIVIDEEGGKKKKDPPAGNSKQSAPAKQPALAKQTKHVKEKTTNPSPSKKIHKGKVMKVHKGKRSDHLVDEEGEEAPVRGVAIHEPVSGITLQLPVVEGNRKGIVSNEQAAQSLLDLQKPKKKSITIQYIVQRRTLITQDASTGPSAQPQDDTFANVVHDTPSLADPKTGADTKKSNIMTDIEILNVAEEQGEEVSNTVALEERTVEIDEGQAGSDPGKTPESRPPPDRVLMEED